MRCAAQTEEASPEGVESDEGALTAMHYYECRSSFSDDMLTRVEVGIGASKIEFTDLSKDAAPPDTGRLDPSYRPTPTFTGAIRFDGFSTRTRSSSITAAA